MLGDFVSIFYFSVLSMDLPIIDIEGLFYLDSKPIGIEIVNGKINKIIQRGKSISLYFNPAEKSHINLVIGFIISYDYQFKIPA